MKRPLLAKICLAAGILAIVGTFAFFVLTFMFHVTDDKEGHEALWEARRIVQMAGQEESVVIPRQSLDALAQYVEWHRTWITAGCNWVFFLGVLLIVTGAVGLTRRA